MLQVIFAQSTTSSTGSNVGGLIALLLYVAVIGVLLTGMWKMFVKAGRPGWAAIIPFYNSYVLTQIAGRPGWWFLLLFVPIVNFAVVIVLGMDIAKRFGRGTAFGAVVCGLLGIGYAILGFDSSRYDSAPQTHAYTNTNVNGPASPGITS